jgi:molybdate transport system substrate-binding protein
MRTRLFAASFLVVFSCLCSGWVAAQKQEMSVAAASDLSFVLHDLAEEFEKQTGKQVKLSFGSSGNFFAQIQNGAPYDVFFSADIQYPQKLEQAGLAEPGTLFRYATGKLVLWVPNESPINVERGLSALVDASVKKIAIANPAHAPYGRAAVAALRKENIYDKLATKLVLGENISQTAQFVLTGNADAGIIALSLALSPPMQSEGKYFLIPQQGYPTIEQAAVILRSAKNKGAAREFLEFVKTPESVALFKRYGFSPGVAGDSGQPKPASKPKK